MSESLHWKAQTNKKQIKKKKKEDSIHDCNKGNKNKLGINQSWRKVGYKVLTKAQVEQRNYMFI